MRIGIGYDVHRTVEKERKLILGGVDIPYKKGLQGHSDADVLVHAIMDSILGAMCAGDIGKHFPPSDPQYRDISSILLLERVAGLMRAQGLQVGNIDSVIVAQQPRLAPYIEQMRENISGALGCEISQISVKATTEEWLGFTGNGTGISAQAVCILTNTNLQ